jgi:methylase of polypeptide subunit release factors
MVLWIKLKVTPDVLIPRPETEELVEWIFWIGKKVSIRFGSWIWDGVDVLQSPEIFIGRAGFRSGD